MNTDDIDPPPTVSGSEIRWSVEESNGERWLVLSARIKATDVAAARRLAARLIGPAIDGTAVVVSPPLRKSVPAGKSKKPQGRPKTAYHAANALVRMAFDAGVTEFARMKSMAAQNKVSLSSLRRALKGMGTVKTVENGVVHYRRQAASSALKNKAKPPGQTVQNG